MQILALLALTHFVGSASAPKAESVASQPLRLTLAIPESTMPLGIQGNQNNLYVMFSQTGSAPIRVWGQQCSWGYEMLSFELRSPDTGAIMSLKRLPRPWYKNIPYTVEISQDRHFVRSAALGDGTWPRLPIPINEIGRYWVRAVYEVAADEMTKNHKVVTGKVFSQWELVDFRNHIAAPPTAIP
jgi:hypothetical protein